VSSTENNTQTAWNTVGIPEKFDNSPDVVASVVPMTTPTLRRSGSGTPST